MNFAILFTGFAAGIGCALYLHWHVANFIFKIPALTGLPG